MATRFGSSVHAGGCPRSLATRVDERRPSSWDVRLLRVSELRPQRVSRVLHHGPARSGVSATRPAHSTAVPRHARETRGCRCPAGRPLSGSLAAADFGAGDVAQSQLRGTGRQRPRPGTATAARPGRWRVRSSRGAHGTWRVLQRRRTSGGPTSPPSLHGWRASPMPSWRP